MVLHGVASSTTTDLHGDTMEPTALEDMERDANAGLTIFLNHSYNVPEDVGGQVTRAKMLARGVDGEGNPNHDLDFDLEINDENPRAISAWKAIDRGHKIGLSIGAMIPQGGATREKNGAYRIHHVKLLETSIVGIPANPRSWIQNSVGCTCGNGQVDPKCRRNIDPDLQLSTTHQLGAPTLTLDGGKYKIEGSIEGLQLAGVTGEELEAAPPAGPRILEINPEILASICGVEDEARMGLLCSNAPAHLGRHSWDPVDGPNGITEAACPDCGGQAGSPKGRCSNSMHKDVAPDVTDARVQVITIDTDDPKPSEDSPPAQDAPESDPEDEGEYSAPVPDVVASANALLESVTGEVELTHLQGVLDLLRQTTQELVDTRRQLGESVAANVGLTQERDHALAETGDIIAQVARIIQTVGDMPMGRKAHVVRSAAAQEVSALTERLQGGPFSDDFLKMLTEGGPAK